MSINHETIITDRNIIGEYSIVSGNNTNESHLLGPEEQVSQRNQAHSVLLDENEDEIGSEAAIILERAMY